MKDETKFKKNYRQPFAKKSFGQNFLVDGIYINKIIRALDPQVGETIVEIGAGRGALTEKLVESGANIIAIELERDMIAVLKDKFGKKENFQLVEADALKTDYSRFQIPDSRFKIKLVANLPYYISTAILQKLIERREVFSEMILMFQREVVQRITAESGNKERGFLSVLVQTYLETDKLFDVPPTAFRPAPKVWSSIVRLTPKSEKNVDNEELFREIISSAFRQKRKTILNNLKNSGETLTKLFEKNGGIEKILENGGIENNRRAETLSVSEWVKMCNSLV